MNDIDHEQEYSRRWEDEASFNDVLAEQIRKAPYVLISIAVHAVLAFIISGWIILTSTTSEAPTITVQAPPPPPDIEEEEPPEEEIVEEIVEEPVLQENEIEEVVEQAQDLAFVGPLIGCPTGPVRRVIHQRRTAGKSDHARLRRPLAQPRHPPVPRRAPKAGAGQSVCDPVCQWKWNHTIEGTPTA